MKRLEIRNGFSMRMVGEKDFIPAVVPGSVYTDLLREGKMEDPFFKDNEDKALALMDNDFEYVCEFEAPSEIRNEENVILRFEGLDTLADVFVNGKLLGSTKNMHRTYEFDVKDILKDKNDLKVVFYSPTKFIEKAYAEVPTKGSEDAMPGFVHIRKAHCSFGWDWGAHLPDAGIYRPVYLFGYHTARIDSVEILQFHENGKVELEITPEIQVQPIVKNGSLDGADVSYEITITDPEGKAKTYADMPERISIENPKLWWPHGYGSQPLYTIKVVIKDEAGEELDSWQRRVGLRTMTMSTMEDQWGNEFATVVNGVKIFAMGADYIPEDHLLGRVTPETTRALLEKCVFANFNSIRVWGGGYYPDDWFFDICDELGIVVWQDFMFACGVYNLTKDFEANITSEFVDVIKRIRHHASLGLMCGNNEMEMFVKYRVWVSNDAEVRDYLIMYERIIPGLMEELAPQVFYWPASPSSGGSFDDPADPNRGDQHYWDVWHENKPFSEYRNYFFRYASEFGFQSFPAMKTVEQMSDDPKDYNIFSYVMERHQRNGAANGKIMNYMQQTYLYPSEFETVLYASQLLQADAIRYGVEHFRRNRGRCMGAIYWQLNDCWPVASWSSIDYCGRLKALHYYAKRFFAPVMLSCEENGMINSGKPLNWLPKGFEQSFRLCVANESMKEEKLTVKWQLRDAKAKVFKSEEQEVLVPALTSVWMDKVDMSDMDIFAQYISYQAFRGDVCISEGTTILSLPKYFKYENPELKVRVEGDELVVTATSYAKAVEILNDNEDLILSDNYFDMNAGEHRVKVLSGKVDNLRLRSVYDIR
ncbi:MAG: glycoside hydrolase family 2 protein [Pseudobutyrivibrio sp.]|nr:glycoside hydrolase family 2 protein [Pseudobutyrivibrio sp.]